VKIFPDCSRGGRKPFPLGAASLALLAALFLASGCKCGVPPCRQVLFILVDALRADRLSIAGYPRNTTPNLDGLARRGVLFCNHFVQGTATRESLPQILLSRYFTPPLFPGSREVPLSSPEELFQAAEEASTSLPRALSRTGMHTAAISAHSWLREETPFAREFDELYNLSSTTKSPPNFGHPRAAAVTDAAIQWIGQHREEAFFLYLHYMEPHFPRPRIEETERFLDPEVDVPEVRDRFNPSGHPGPVDVLQPRERRYFDALYDGSVAHADHHLGRLLAYLKEAGALEGMLIIITADHGEYLLEAPGLFDHGGPWYDSVAHVPLILSRPGVLEPRVFKGLTAAVDVMPTILSLSGRGLPAGKTADGRNLAPFLQGKTEPGEEVVLSPHGVRAPTKKLILGGSALLRVFQWFRQGGPAPSAAELELELYDLAADPRETRNLAGVHLDEAERLLQIYLKNMKAPYLRHAQSRSLGPPNGAFAIAARHFTVKGLANPLVPPGGWHQDLDWARYRLLADAGAPPVLVSFGVPSGEYALSISIRGRLRLTLPDGHTVMAAGRPVPERLEPGQAIEGDIVELGTAVVRDNSFSVKLAPLNPKRPVLIRHIGFTPAGAERPDQELKERLHTLGYIH